MCDIDDLLTEELKKLPQKPSDSAGQTDKKRYSELMSAAAARAFGEALHRKGLKGTIPRLGDGPRTAKLVTDTGAGEVEGDDDQEESSNEA